MPGAQALRLETAHAHRPRSPKSRQSRGTQIDYMSHMNQPAFLVSPPRFLFFTGKGGVGKTSLSASTALALADEGKRVLLVSTDAASNLDEILGVPLQNDPVRVPGVTGLSVLNIDPDAAAEAYRRRVLAQMEPTATAKDTATVREQLSGACTTEIAAFDEFAALLADGGAGYDHVVFDTAPTGHTLRLLSLPKAWTGFLEDNERGAECLGPHSGVKMKEPRFKAALAALIDPSRTAVVLVTRPEPTAISEAARTAEELTQLGFSNQQLAVNGVFHASRRDDAVALAIEATGEAALATLPPQLEAMPRSDVPLLPFDMVGLEALRALLGRGPRPDESVRAASASGVGFVSGRGLAGLADDLAAQDHGLVMVMGKGGVGKTTIAAALAVGLVERGRSVHLTTTDPAAHVIATIGGELPGLRVSRIDPKVETERYVEKIMASRGAHLDAQGRALLREDLRSPCTEEVAVFHAFSQIVGESRSGFVVLDTAPTGHSMLLIDATGAYHRQTLRAVDKSATPLRVVTPLMRLQDATTTRVILVTVPEPTPVSQAAALQEDLRRAHIEPIAWVINRSIAAAQPRDPVLANRASQERRQFERVAALTTNTFVVPYQVEAPVGLLALARLTAPRPTKAARTG
jgi:arsenite-transporting ATPase